MDQQLQIIAQKAIDMNMKDEYLRVANRFTCGK